MPQEGNSQCEAIGRRGMLEGSSLQTKRDNCMQQVMTMDGCSLLQIVGIVGEAFQSVGDGR